MYVLNAILQYFRFFGWRDSLEILFFSTLFYYFSLWLSTDTKKDLLLPFYGYWFVAFTSYGLQLTSMTFFLFTFSPIVLIFFILVHQEFLQRNFIQLKKSAPAVQPHNDWLELLMRICLQTISKNKEILIIIEQEDSLQDVVSIPFHIDTELDHTLLTLLIDGASFDQTKFIWLTKQGRFLGINATWKNLIHQAWFDKNTDHLEQWKQDALAITHKTDALIFGITPLARTFTIIAHGKMLEDLQGAAALRIIKKFLQSPSDNKKGIMYDYTENRNNNPIHP